MKSARLFCPLPLQSCGKICPVIIWLNQSIKWDAMDSCALLEYVFLLWFLTTKAATLEQCRLNVFLRGSWKVAFLGVTEASVIFVLCPDFTICPSIWTNYFLTCFLDIWRGCLFELLHVRCLNFFEANSQLCKGEKKGRERQIEMAYMTCAIPQIWHFFVSSKVPSKLRNNTCSLLFGE